MSIDLCGHIATMVHYLGRTLESSGKHLMSLLRNFQEDSRVVKQSLWDLWVQTVECSKVGNRRRREVVSKTQHGSDMRTRAHKKSEERDLTTEDRGGKQQLLPDSQISEQKDWLNLQRHINYWWFQRLPQSNTTSRMEEWTLWTAMVGN